MRTRSQRDAELFAMGAALSRSPTVNAPTSVTVNQQPNDAADAARLYGEMREKVKDEIVERVRVGNTHIECVVDTHYDVMTDVYLMRAMYKIGGKPMVTDVGLTTREQREGTDKWRKLADAMAHDIAAQLLYQLFTLAPR